MDQPSALAYQDDYVFDSEQSPAGHVAFYADGAQEIVHANHYILNLFECDSIQDFLELTQGTFRHLACKEDRAAIEKHIAELMHGDQNVNQVFFRIRTKTGSLVNVMDFSRLTHDEEAGRPLVQCIIARVQVLNKTDYLTGLPSMTAFHDLARQGAKRIFEQGERPVAIALDIMGMKDFNARYGRVEGDRLLFKLANVLRKHFGGEACSRFAEDHYYAFAAEKDVEQKLDAVFSEFSEMGSPSVPPIRAGIYALEPDDDIVASGFDQAKLACDLDRSTWQFHITWFTEGMREAARRRIHVLEHLDQAIAEGWIQPYYQAIVRSSTGNICNEEALARWMDPEFGPLYPDQFIPDLEEAGLLYKLDLHIVDCVVRDMLIKQCHGVPLVPVSMNFSLRDLMRLDLAKELARRADDAGIARGLLRVELTESVASSDPAFLRKQLAALHAAGFEVWMDDFGSGYSSLNTLQEFDFDLVKLDMGFLRSNKVEKSQIIMASVVQAAGRLGVATLAEGVEIEDQAAFLESIGCDKLQGFHYAKPHSLDEILDHIAHHEHHKREDFAEKSYWDTISLLDFNDMVETGQEQTIEQPMQVSPMGVLERRRGQWRVLRGNREFYEFLDRRGVLSAGHCDLEANPVERPLDPEVDIAAQKSLHDGTWERIAGSIEQGESFQFFLKHVTSSTKADAFLFAGVATMLGAALGSYGDVPMAYAVFRVQMNDERTEVLDAEYVYANDRYHAWCGFAPGELTGRSFMEAMDNADRTWFSYCYRAVVNRENVHDVVYSPEIGHWLSFYLAPSPMENCCVYAFAKVDDERREHEEIMVSRNTSELIISLANLMNSSMGYHDLMNRFLILLSEVIHPDRLYIYERGKTSVSRTIEWCAPGVVSYSKQQCNVPIAQCAAWDDLLAKNEVAVISSVEELRESDPTLYATLKQQHVDRVLAVPLYHSGRLVGVLGADNYVLEANIDMRRLLMSIAPFVSARIVSNNLLNELEYLNTHDDLTLIYNRHGVDLAIAARLAEQPDEPYALVLMDIDDFKVLNDVHGHEVGDALLRLLARIITDAFPEGAVLGRNGGDEFVAMLQGRDSARVEQILQSIVDTEKTFELDGTWYFTTLSMGYVSCPEQTNNLRTAYSMADTALYAAKLTGKSCFRRYAGEMETQYRMKRGFTPADIAKSVPGSIMVHLPGDGKILFANDELVDLFECENLAEFMDYTGGTFGGMIHPDDRERVHDELAEQMSIDDVGCKDFVDYRIITKQGNTVRVANNGRLVELEGFGKVFYELIINQEERGIRA